MRVAAPVDDVWRRVLAAAPLRGALAGYTGTAVLEEADDDERVARFRLQGMSAGAPAAARVTAALSPAGAGTEIALFADVFGEVAPGALLAAVAAAAGPVLAPAEPAPDAPVGDVAPPADAAPDEAAPVAPPAIAAADEAAPAPHGLSSPAKGALVAAGAALAVWALRGRR
jgi:hypothetical protein